MVSTSGHGSRVKQETSRHPRFETFSQLTAPLGVRDANGARAH